ncbi:kinase-like domain-containing protein [Suillus lakei]|nr:kinase-like domain-containing protein [Suillus lakei]
MEFTPQDEIFCDFTSQISGMLQGKESCGNGAFGWVYQFTIESSEGPKEVAVKIFNMAPHIGRAQEKINHGIRREIHTWLKLRDSTNIVPLFGFANFPEHALPALVSEWMPSGTLYDYLEKPAEIIAKVNLAKGVADGLKYLHSNNVVHGDLHPGNVLVDGSGNARLTDFGLATVVGDEEWQWNSTTAGRNFNPQWRAPEVIGVGQAGSIIIRPNFKSDVYSFGSVMFFIVSGVMPWKEKRTPNHITIGLSKRATPARLDNIIDDHRNLINKCWSWDPARRPDAKEVATEMATILGETDVAATWVVSIYSVF